MTQTPVASVNLPEEIVETVVRQQISMAIATALGDPDRVVASLVNGVINQQVNSSGHRSKYHNDNKYSLVEVLEKKTIEKAMKNAMEEFVAGQQPKIKRAVSAYLKSNSNSVAEQIVHAMATGMMGYRLSAKFDITKDN